MYILFQNCCQNTFCLILVNCHCFIFLWCWNQLEKVWENSHHQLKKHWIVKIVVAVENKLYLSRDNIVIMVDEYKLYSNELKNVHLLS